jgi:peptidoglycan DL-endopeptidase CwlO
MKKPIVASLLAALVMTSSVTTVFAASTSDKLDAAQGAASKAKSNLSSAKSELSDVETELANLLISIDQLVIDMESKEEEIATAQNDLTTAEANLDEQKEVMTNRMQNMYENNGQTMLASLLEADSLADFLNKVEYMSAVYSYDQECVDNYNVAVTEVETRKSELETQYTDMQSLEAEYDSQQTNLEAKEAEISAQVDDYETVYANAVAQVEKYENQLAEEKAAAEAKAKAEAEAKAKAAAQQQAQTAASTGGAASSVSAAAASTSSSTTSSSQSSSSASTESSSSSSSASTSTESSSEDSSSEETSSVAASSIGSAVVAYACQFIGNPYVWGGTSLTEGADCSGFVMSVYAHFGYSLPHSSAALRSVGTGVSVSDMQPGDIVCYSGHVGIYAGGGQMVNAASAATGIKYTNVNYKPILAVRRIG